MGFRDGMKKVWNKIKEGWVENMERDHKKISAGFGMMAIIIIGALIAFWSALAIGVAVDFGFTFGKILGGIEGFLILFIGVFFGHKNGIIKESKEEE